MESETPNSAGRIIVLPNPGEALTWTAAPLHAFEFGKSVSGLQFTDSGTLVITAGSDVAVWNFTQPKPEPLNGHSAQITGLDLGCGDSSACAGTSRNCEDQRGRAVP